jgi:hypothetical protein
MKNFAGSRKVAHILKVWALLSTKIPISSKSVENSSVMSHSPHIFVISKNQIFRICATFLDPVKFSILVIHLLIITFFQKIIFKCEYNAIAQLTF